MAVREYKLGMKIASTDQIAKVSSEKQQSTILDIQTVCTLDSDIEQCGFSPFYAMYLIDVNIQNLKDF